MRNRYKRHDNLIDLSKHTFVYDKNKNNSSAFNLKSAKNPLNKNAMKEL